MADLYVCTYEKYVIGYHFGYREEEEDMEYAPDGPRFQLLFRDHSALGSLRCLAASSSLLACAGADETIYSFAMEHGRGIEAGANNQHTGTVTCMDLYKDTFLISGGDDGRLCIWDCRGDNGFNLLKQFLIKHSFLSISIHQEAGKVALTLDSGGYLKVWDLYKCCLAYSLPLKKTKPHTVKWFSPKISCIKEKCDRFVVLSNYLADVRRLESGDSIQLFSVKDRGQLTCIDFIDQKTLIAGNSMGDLIFMYTTGGAHRQTDLRQVHQGRIKSVVVLGEDSREIRNTSEVSWTLFSASSDGFLKAWKVDLEKRDLKLISLVDVKCRITDLSAVTYDPWKKNQK